MKKEVTKSVAKGMKAALDVVLRTELTQLLVLSCISLRHRKN